jgi:hypothetical protein
MVVVLMVIRNRGVDKTTPHFYYTDFTNEIKQLKI